MGQEVLKKFDRYFLLDCVAQGGMAEIFRARMATKEAVNRLVVIKRILAGYGRNAEFRKMFKSEIKVMMGFNHPNIVQLYDFGETKGQPYIAMELIDGRNLRHFITRINELNQKFPVDLGVFIIEQVAGGLHYAHTFKDKISGEPMNIIHRDVSPQNILISYDGNVKIIDFGIAKATTNGEATRVGIIKGKPSYLSPEQIVGEVLDQRSDVFALGAVLWEVLTGKKLFAAEKGENEFAVLKLIEAADTFVKPPSTLNPAIPKELDAIVMKALTKKRENRYQSAEEMQRALHRFLYSHAPEFNPHDLSYMAKNLFKEEIVADRKWIKKLNTKAEQLIESDLSGFMTHYGKEEISISGRTPASDATFIDPRAGSTNNMISNPATGSENRVQIDNVNSNDIQIERVPMDRSGPRSSRRGSAPEPALTPASSQKVRAPKQRGAESASSGKGKSAISGFAAAVILVAATGLLFGDRLPWLDVFKRRPAATAQNNPDVSGGGVASGLSDASDGATEAVQSKKILLRLSLRPDFGQSKISLNGKPLDSTNPAAKVLLDAPLELSVEKEGFKPYRSEFVISGSSVRGTNEKLMVVALEPERFGFLSVSSMPSADAAIWMVDSKTRRPSSDAKPWVVSTPFENEKLPVGMYTIKLENKVLGMQKIVEVQVQEGKAVKVNERLELTP